MDNSYQPLNFSTRIVTIEDFVQFTTDATNGHTILYWGFNANNPPLPNHTLMAGAPTRSGTGVWSVTLNESSIQDVQFGITLLMASTGHLIVIEQPITFTTDGTNRPILNWTFESAIGTPADIPASTVFSIDILVTLGQD